MIICFKCEKEVKKVMDSLIGEGKYGDISELISTAVHNLALLHVHMDASGSLVLGGDATVIPAPKPPNEHTEGKRVVKKPDGNVPELFLLNREYSVQDVAPTPQISADPSPTIDKWIFGQYNKLLPLKAVCRALANIGHEISIKDVHDRISKEAAGLGDYLRTLDKKNDNKREYAFSTAFPTRIGPEAHKGVSRFSNQFVAYMNAEGNISSLPVIYQMLALRDAKAGTIFVTHNGLEFARLENPILDALDAAASSVLSEKEQRYLHSHIKRNVPVEAYAFKTLLECINEGHNTPETLDKQLGRLHERTGRAALKPAFLSTQRSGAISRMADVGLVERVKDGVRVTYKMTEIGKEFI